MGKHNVVIVSFKAGESGINATAFVAKSMLLSLPHIRVGLLVGIGGGIPSARRDIRLGDVAVSKPKDRSGGVVKQGQKHEGKDFLGKPPSVLLKVPKLLDDVFSKYPKLAEPTDERATFTFPRSNVDRLFKDGYEHQGGDDYRGCDKSQLLPTRKLRPENHPKIHYGIIASGNTVVKDAINRKQLIEHLSDDCICYEMEAAGLMDEFPCLVIRGICDYADSHKNDGWHPYAAATAAAFAKELLEFVPQYDLEKNEKAIEAVKAVAKDRQ